MSADRPLTCDRCVALALGRPPKSTVWHEHGGTDHALTPLGARLLIRDGWTLALCGTLVGLEPGSA